MGSSKFHILAPRQLGATRGRLGELVDGLVVLATRGHRKSVVPGSVLPLKPPAHTCSGIVTWPCSTMDMFCVALSREVLDM
jgi:hypothetical protein